MNTPITVVVLAMLGLACTPASAAERACRPSLSNWYHCPDTSKPAQKPKTTTTTSERPCRPSLSNLWTCPDASKARQRTTRASKPKPTRTTSAPERGCRPSLSNAFKCPPESQAGENQYNTERKAWAQCPTDMVVWANTRSNIYHFRGTHYYGTTVVGAYMCEQEAIAQGMRAAKNETRP